MNCSIAAASGLGLLVVHHVSRVRDRDAREARNELTHSLDRGVIREASRRDRNPPPRRTAAGRVISRQHASASSRRYRIGIDALVSWVGAHPDAAVRRPGSAQAWAMNAARSGGSRGLRLLQVLRERVVRRKTREDGRLAQLRRARSGSARAPVRAASVAGRSPRCRPRARTRSGRMTRVHHRDVCRPCCDRSASTGASRRQLVEQRIEIGEVVGKPVAVGGPCARGQSRASRVRRAIAPAGSASARNWKVAPVSIQPWSSSHGSGSEPGQRVRCIRARARRELLLRAHAVADRWSAQLAEKHPVGGIRRLVDVGVVQLAQVKREIVGVRGRHLHAGQHAAVIRAVVAVMEQADVPARADRLEKLAAARRGARETRSETAARARARARGRRPCTARAASPSRRRSCRRPG